MMKKFFVAAALGLALTAVQVQAQELTPADGEIAQQYGTILAEQFAKDVTEPQVKVDPNFEKAGLLALGMEGLLIIPAKGLDPATATENPDADSEKGAGLGILFVSPRFNPLIDGKPIEESKLRTLTFSDGQGTEQKATVLLLAAKHVEGEDWRLYVYGSEDKPLIEAQLGPAEEVGDPEKDVLTLHPKDVKDNKAQLEVKIFGIYSGSFEIGHNVEDLF